MNRARFVITQAVLYLASTVYGQHPYSDEALLKQAGDRDGFSRMTAKRFALGSLFSDMCDTPVPRGPWGHEKLPGGSDAEIHIYVSKASAEVFKDRRSRFPVGTMVLKEKYPTPEAKTPILYTGMLKREPGFNPTVGDWEFFTLTGDRKTMTSRGRLESCMDCHRDFAKTDFITRRIR